MCENNWIFQCINLQLLKTFFLPDTGYDCILRPCFELLLNVKTVDDFL